MEKFTAVYNTSTMKAVEYYFKSKNTTDAIKFCKTKFSAKTILIVNHDKQETTYIGDETTCKELEKIFLGRHGNFV